MVSRKGKRIEDFFCCCRNLFRVPSINIRLSQASLENLIMQSKAIIFSPSYSYLSDLLLTSCHFVFVIPMKCQ